MLFKIRTKLPDDKLIAILSNFIPVGWEVFTVSPHGNSIKIRRPYPPTAINFNADGYEYNELSFNPTKTAHYLTAIDNGIIFDSEYIITLKTL